MPKKEKEELAEEVYLAELEISPEIKVHSRLLRDNMSGFEKKVWKLLGGEGNPWSLLRQIPVCGYFLDFYSPEAMACIEADGPHHVFNKEHDLARDIELRKQGIRTLRITPRDFKRMQPLDLLGMIGNFIETDDDETPEPQA